MASFDKDIVLGKLGEVDQELLLQINQSLIILFKL
jgi:hypothetical protein